MMISFKKNKLKNRLIFKHDKQYTNKLNITLPLLIVTNIQEQQNQRERERERDCVGAREREGDECV